MGLLKTAFEIAYQKTPIILCDGLAKDIPGGMLPIAVLTEGLSLINGLVGSGSLGLDTLSANYRVMPGTTLINQNISTYPFLNQATAANATVKLPNRVLINMTRPATTTNGGYVGKIAAFLPLKLALDRHHEAGGTYTVLTPSYFYTGCILRNLVDVSNFSEEIKQVQYEWAFEFEQPLLLPSELDTQTNGFFDSAAKGTPADAGSSFSGGTSAITGVLPV